ncbi:hypothetical protein [Limnoglobus roseus]|uniref:Uncharacterized protein n=1 Tax=Limnoglobus roseus TaxID=2598579 RepID=A0A5C1A8Y5_9BACT|nr:hypothetical protein [Limnoglobus roseus]QEL15651.1 hypothetical protein PX52LOC_02586 [Limnoglobus roseus]
MALATRETVSDRATPLDVLHDMVGKFRQAVEGLVFTNSPSSLSSVTQLLSIVPLDVCEKLCAAAAVVSPGEIRRSFPNEDRLLIDMVLAMYDNLRVDAGPRTPTNHLAESARVG